MMQWTGLLSRGSHWAHQPVQWRRPRATVGFCSRSASLHNRVDHHAAAHRCDPPATKAAGGGRVWSEGHHPVDALFDCGAGGSAVNRHRLAHGERSTDGRNLERVGTPPVPARTCISKRTRKMAIDRRTLIPHFRTHVSERLPAVPRVSGTRNPSPPVASEAHDSCGAPGRPVLFRSQMWGTIELSGRHIPCPARRGASEVRSTHCWLWAGRLTVQSSGLV